MVYPSGGTSGTNGNTFTAAEVALLITGAVRDEVTAAVTCAMHLLSLDDAAARRFMDCAAALLVKVSEAVDAAARLARAERDAAPAETAETVTGTGAEADLSYDDGYGESEYDAGGPFGDGGGSGPMA